MEDSERGAELPTDAKLMAQVAHGDMGAFEHLVLRHQGSAWNAAMRFVGDATEVEDIVQEAFLRIYRGAANYVPLAAFRTYLFRIVNRLCLDFVEKKRPLPTQVLPDQVDGRPSAENVAADADSRREIQQALARLPSSQRMAIVLRYYEGLGYAEIAQAMETTEKSVERLLARARTALHGILTTTF